MVRGQQGQPRRRRQVVAPDALEQPPGLAQGQAVRGQRQVRQQDIGRTACECLAEPVQRVRAAIEGGASDDIPGGSQRSDHQRGGAAFIMRSKDKNVKHGDAECLFQRAYSEKAASLRVKEWKCRERVTVSPTL